ncbi:MAG: hypothetical protein GWN93_06650 [Deltaproteobacteria bacterium]|nr:hypothetical protein [Deltaproteobacteria bacterium]
MMKRALLVIALLALIIHPAPAQEERQTYLPFVASSYRGEAMSTWKIIVPEATTNYCLNPSAETTGNFAAVGGGAITRVNTSQFFDVYSYRIVSAANNEGGDFTLLALSNNIHYVTMRVAGTLPTAWDWSLDNATYTAPTLIEDIDGTWSLYGLQFPAAQANGSTLLYVRQNGAGAGDFNLDGIQVEQKTYWTTFCDGTREGCEWNGAEHASTSTRSAVSRAGGRVRDLEDDYNFRIGSFISTGMPPVTNTVDSYAILPGGELNAIKIESRVFTLTGVIQGTSVSNLHANRQSLLDVLKPGAVPADAAGPQPVRLRYTGATVQKQISAHYEGGLETRIEATLECWERLAIRFLADDPYWYEIGDSADVLDSNDTATLRYLAGRLRSTGQWDDLNVAANPLAIGNGVRAIAIAPDKTIYIGGEFTRWNNVVGRDYVARYDPQTDTWSTVGGASDFTNLVYDLKFGPDGTLYAGGLFQNAAGDANADYIAQWDGANWSAVSGGGTGAVWDILFGLDGTMYLGGNFVNWNAIANADNIVSWNGAAYAAVGTGTSAAVYCLDVTPDGDIIAGGNFVTAGGVTVNQIARWDGSAWNALGDGFNLNVYDVAVASDGTVYACGDFTTNHAATENFGRIAEWNGTSWSQLGTGLAGNCLALDIAPNGILLAGGPRTAGVDRVNKWNGASWAALDVDFPGASTIVRRAIATGNQDPVVPNNFDLYVGFTTTGAGYFNGSATVTNGGTEAVYPTFIISRSGGTTATILEIRNETTGLELLLNYDLLDGETLTIDLTPTSKSVVSNFFGVRMDAILANSDFGTFNLLPGDNQITSFVNVAGGPTVNAFIQFDDKYWSND